MTIKIHKRWYQDYCIYLKIAKIWEFWHHLVSFNETFDPGKVLYIFIGLDYNEFLIFEMWGGVWVTLLEIREKSHCSVYAKSIIFKPLVHGMDWFYD